VEGTAATLEVDDYRTTKEIHLVEILEDIDATYNFPRQVERTLDPSRRSQNAPLYPVNSVSFECEPPSVEPSSPKGESAPSGNVRKCRHVPELIFIEARESRPNRWGPNFGHFNNLPE
jgi:hypothetical protein